MSELAFAIGGEPLSPPTAIPQEYNALPLWDILPDILLPQVILLFILAVSLLIFGYFKRSKNSKKDLGHFLAPTGWKLFCTVLIVVLPFALQGVVYLLFKASLWIVNTSACWHNNCPLYTIWYLLFTQILLSYFLSCNILELYGKQRIKKTK
jgi:tellurite resistance protein TehA-like permease